jgi:tRNA(Ile)-lysidine synthase
MIKLLVSVPKQIYLAFSGGVDSLSVAHFLKKGKRDITLLHFNHGCEHSDKIEREVWDWGGELGLPLIVKRIGPQKAPKISLEEHWRNERYAFLRSYGTAHYPVITCHHLDDAIETWVWSSLHGEGKLIPIHNRGILRPFLTTEKKTLVEYAAKHGLIPVDDPYNRENQLMRNYMRANMMDDIYFINPGLKKVIRKKYLTMDST